MDPESLSMALGLWGYPALLLLLILTGVGPHNTPGICCSPPDTWCSARSSIGRQRWWVSLNGVVISDVMLYSAGRHLAWRSTRWSDGRMLFASASSGPPDGSIGSEI